MFLFLKFQTFPASTNTAPLIFQNIPKRYSALTSNFISPVWLGIEKTVSRGEVPGPTFLACQPRKLLEPPL